MDTPWASVHKLAVCGRTINLVDFCERLSGVLDLGITLRCSNLFLKSGSSILEGSWIFTSVTGAHSLFNVVVEFFSVAVLAELGKRFGFDLADAFAGYAELLAYFFQGVRFAVF